MLNKNIDKTYSEETPKARGGAGHIETTGGTGGTGGVPETSFGSTGGTGGRGGPEFINDGADKINSDLGQQGVGSTGATGGHCLTPPANVYDKDFNLKAYCNEVAFTGFVGATGGMGLTGDDGKEIIVPTTVEEARSMPIRTGDLRKVFIEKIGRIDSADLLIEQVKQHLDVLSLTEQSANSQVALQALIIGLVLLKLQAKRYETNKRDWTGWAKKNLPFLKKRTREKYMAIGALPCSDRHLVLGVDRLADIGVYYSSLDDEVAAKLGEDPVAEIMKRNGFLNDESYEERKLAMDALVEVLKLEKRGVILEELSVKDIEELLELSGDFTGAKRSFLVTIYGDQGEEGIKEFIKLVTEENGKWDRAEKLFYPESAQNDKHDANSTKKDRPAMVASIPELTTTLSQSIKILLDDSQASFDGVEVGDLDQLLADIQTLKDRVAAVEAAAAEESEDAKEVIDTKAAADTKEKVESKESA